MKKHLLFFVAVFSIVGSMLWLWYYYGAVVYNDQASTPGVNSKAQIQVTDYMNNTYLISGRAITLINGHSEISDVAGAATKTITQYFGNNVAGDLNGDGTIDVAFIVTQHSGGSGTFYYVVAAVNTINGYKGTNAIALGDRIAPQTTEIKDGQLIVNYADHMPNEPMTVRPSVGVSKYLKVQGTTLIEIRGY